ncbi:MAG: T9SS type A sorting domain-containing protein [Cyclobacteriaceae bacterium]|nr:T9SS type A sorting domain-containing protein [Cyclobacteriaceae bacterium]
MKRFYMSLMLAFTCLTAFSQFSRPLLENINDLILKEGSAYSVVFNAVDNDNNLKINNPRIVILGSSTAVGSGSTNNMAWVTQYRQFLYDHVPGSFVQNLSVGGYTSYQFRETGFVPGISGRPRPDQQVNITKALTYDPDIIIVNLPSNDFASGFADQETYNNFNAIKAIAEANGVKIIFHTTQPRNFSTLSERQHMFTKAEYIKSHYSPDIVNTYDYLTDFTNYKILSYYNADNIHVNNAGHTVIFNKTLSATKYYTIGDTVTFEVSGLPSFASYDFVDSGEGRISFSPGFSDAGIYAITVKAIDSDGNEDLKNFVLTVEDKEPLSNTQQEQNFTYTLNNGGTLDYYIYYPQDFDSQPDDRPVLVSLHGKEEKDGDITKLLGPEGYGSPAYLAHQGQNFPLMIVSPHQLSNVGGTDYEYWNLDLINEFINHLKSVYKIDENRVYLTGFSEGGQAAWQYAIAHPEVVTALIPMAASTDLTNQYFGINLQASQFACSLHEIPTQVWHGDADSTINIDHSINMVNAINSCVPPPSQPSQLRMLTGVNHQDLKHIVYGNIAESDNIYDWMMQFVKGIGIVDIFPPQFINGTPSIDNITDHSFNLNVELNEPGTFYYASYQNNYSPTIDEIKSGLGQGLIFFGSGTNSSTTISISNLSSSTSYKVWVFAEDDSEPVNVSVDPISVVAQTLREVDFDPPVFELEPFLEDVGSGYVKISFDIDEEGTILWGLYDDSFFPTVEDIKAGNSLYSGSYSTNGSPETFEIGTLFRNTKYKLAIIAFDTELSPNYTNAVFTIPFITKALDEGVVPDRVFNLNATKTNTSAGLSTWNELGFNSINQSRELSNIKDINGISSSYDFIAYNGAEYSLINEVADNSATYGNGGVFPSSIARYTAYTSGTGKVSLKSLDPDKYYTFKILGARSGSGSKKTKYTLDNTSISLECINNISNLAVFEKVSPPSNGQLFLQFSGVNTVWGYLTALVVEEYNKLEGDITPPSAVPGFQINTESQTGNPMLSWQPSDEPDLGGYAIYRAEGDLYSNGQLEFLLQNNVSSSSFIDSTLNEGIEYFYWIVVLDQSGNYSDISDKVSFTKQPSNPLLPPTSLLLSANSLSISLSWVPSESIAVTSVNVYRFIPGEIPQLIQSVDPSVTSFEDHSTLYNIVYSYFLTAVDENLNESSPSETKEAFLLELIEYPSIPDGLSVYLSAPSQATVYWQPGGTAGISHYDIYRSQTSFMTIGDAQRIGNNIIENQYLDTGLFSETNYYYGVVAINKNNDVSGLSEIVEIVTPDIQAPSAPQNVNLTSELNAIHLTWAASNSIDVNHYNVYRDDAQLPAISDEFLIDTSTFDVLLFIDQIVDEEKTYYYLVTAVDDAGNESVPGNSVSGQSLNITPPSAPVNISARLNASNQIELSWDANIETDFHGYSIWRSQAAFSATSEAEGIASYVTEVVYVDTSVQNDTQYFYGITAVDIADNFSGLSEVISMTTADGIPPSPPDGLLINVVGSSLVLTWNPSTEEDVLAYNVFVSTVSNDSEILDNQVATIAKDDPLVYELALSPAEEGVVYYFMVSATDDSGNQSLPGNISSAFLPNITPPSAPENISARLSAINEINLSWNKNIESDFAAYTVYRSTMPNVLTISENVIGITAANQFTDENLEFNTSYYYRLTAKDSNNNESSTSLEVGATTGIESVEPKIVKVLKLNATNSTVKSGLSEWNDIVFPIPIQTTRRYDLKDSLGQNTSAYLILYNGLNGSTVINVADNGLTLDGGVFPNKIARYVAYTTGNCKMSLKGLNPSSIYQLEFLCGRSGSGSRKTRITVNGENKIIESINNKNNTLLFESVSANSNGDIEFSFGISNDTWSYFNGVIIREYEENANLRIAKSVKQSMEIKAIDFSIYPVPTSDILYLQGEINPLKEYYINIYNLKGNLIYSQSLENQLDNGINVNYPNGAYIIKIVDDQGNSIEKRFIVSK